MKIDDKGEWNDEIIEREAARAFHKRYHWFWVKVWSTLRWNKRAAGHLDAWMQNDESDEVQDPNGVQEYPLCWRLTRRRNYNLSYGVDY